MKNQPFFPRLGLAILLFAAILQSCQQQPETPQEAPQAQYDTLPDPSGTVDLDPGEDLVAYTWNGEFFEETQFPRDRAEALHAFATEVDFDAPEGATETHVNGSTLVFTDLSEGNEYIHNLEAFPTIYIYKAGGRRKVAVPCRTGRLLTHAFGTGNNMYVSAMNQYAERNLVNESGGITTILIATDIGDHGDFFFTSWNPDMLGQLDQIPIAEAEQPEGTSDCFDHSVLVAEVTEDQVDIAQCGNYLYLIGTNSLGLSSCRHNIYLYNECAFCLVRSTTTDAHGQPKERIMVFAKSGCGSELAAWCGPNLNEIPL